MDISYTHPTTGDRLWTARQVAQELGVSDKAVWQWTRNEHVVRRTSKEHALKRGTVKSPRDWFYLSRDRSNPTLVVRVYTEAGLEKLRYFAKTATNTKSARLRRQRERLAEGMARLAKLEEGEG